VTPFNLLPIANANSTDSAGSHSHGAGTPLPLCRWWVRYLCPAGRCVLDPFAGTATVGVACRREGRQFIGFETEPDYVAASHTRLSREQQLLMTAMLEGRM
jgi:DNA modification methylase